MIATRFRNTKPSSPFIRARMLTGRCFSPLFALLFSFLFASVTATTSAAAEPLLAAATAAKPAAAAQQTPSTSNAPTLVTTPLTAVPAGTAVVETAPAPAAPVVTVAPFRAEFDLLRDGDVIGKAVMTLKALTGGEWQFETQTEASLFFLSFSDRETSRLRWQDGQPQPLQFDKLRNRPGKTEVIKQVFNWKAGSENGQKNDQNWSQPLAPGTQDLQSQLLALQADLQAGKTPMRYTVSRYGKVREYRYAITAEETLNTKLGKLKTLRVERIREPNDDRQTISWFAPSLGFVPVRVQQYEDGELQADLQIRKLSR